MSGPERRCAGCGGKRPQRELVRFAAPDGRLVESRVAPGRGVYTCPRLACFERALSRRAFGRVLRRNVTVDPALVQAFAAKSLHLTTDG